MLPAPLTLANETRYTASCLFNLYKNWSVKRTQLPSKLFVCLVNVSVLMWLNFNLILLFFFQKIVNLVEELHFLILKVGEFCQIMIETHNFLHSIEQLILQVIIPSVCVCVTGERCGTPCKTGEFTCANGCCLGPGLECDTKPQCTDGSDELKCDDCKQWLCKLGFIFMHGNITAAMITMFPC